MFYVDGPEYFVYRKKLVLSTKMLLNWFTQHYLGSSPVESIIRDLKFSAQYHNLNIPDHRIRRAFQVFSVATLARKHFVCFICGLEPSIIIYDGNFKGRFDLDIGFALNVAVTAGFDGLVNMENFWDSVERCVWEDSDLPLKIDSNAPYLDPEVARKKGVWNTEFLKTSTLLNLLEKMEPKTSDIDLPRDQFLAMMNLEAQKLSRSELERQMSSMKIGSPVALKNAPMDVLLSVLHEYCRIHFEDFKDIEGCISFDKIYPPARGTSGGYVTAQCPHGIVYGFKFLFRQESVRVIADLMLSFSKTP